jgi:hypothetical protein
MRGLGGGLRHNANEGQDIAVRVAEERHPLLCPRRIKRACLIAVDELGRGIELEAPAAEGIVGGVDVGTRKYRTAAPGFKPPAA